MKRLLFAWLTLFICAGPGFAEEVIPSSVRVLIVVGLKNNIGLQVENLNVPVSASVIEANEAAFDPELFAAVGYLKSATPISSTLSLAAQSESEVLNGQLGLRKQFTTGLLAKLALTTEWLDDNSQTEALDPRYRSGVELNLTQPLLRNFGNESTTSSLRVSIKQMSQAKLQHLLQAQSLALQIELLAAQFAGEKEIVDLRTEAVVLAEELYAANKRRFDIGVIPISEVQEAETALANRELNLSLALQAKELNFENLNSQLNHYLVDNLGSQHLFSFAAEEVKIQLPEFDVLFEATQEKNVTLELASIGVAISEIEQGFYQNQLKPQLDLNLQAGLNGLSGDERDPSVPSSYSGDWSDSFASAAETDGYQWGAALQFSLPLGNRLAESRLRQADLQRKQASYRQRDLVTELRSQLQQHLINLQRAVEQVKIAARFERLAKLSLEQEQRRQEEGLSDTFRVISFQDNMINAKVGQINALVQYYRSLSQLNFTRGIILEQHDIVLADQLEESFREVM